MCYPRRRFGQQRGAAKLHLEHEGRQRGSKVVRFIPTQDTARIQIRNYPRPQLTHPLHQASPAGETQTRNRRIDKVPDTDQYPRRHVNHHTYNQVKKDGQRASYNDRQHSAFHPTHTDHTSKPASIPYQVAAFNRYNKNRQCICRIPKDRKQEQARRKPFASGLQVFDCRPSTTAPLLNDALTYLWHPSSDLNMFSVRSQSESFQPPTYGMTMHSSIRAPGLSTRVVCPAEEEGNLRAVFVH